MSVPGHGEEERRPQAWSGPGGCGPDHWTMQERRSMFSVAGEGQPASDGRQARVVDPASGELITDVADETRGGRARGRRLR